jgi:hypothetical protein
LPEGAKHPYKAGNIVDISIIRRKDIPSISIVKYPIITSNQVYRDSTFAPLGETKPLSLITYTARSNGARNTTKSEIEYIPK